MSEWGAAASVRPWDRPVSGGFRPWGSGPGQVERRADPPVDAETLRAAAYEEGFLAGQRSLEEALEAERAAMARLVEAVETMQPEPTQALGLLLAETVERLVHQIVGEVAIDRSRLEARAQAAAAMIGEETQPATLRLNPMDHARLSGADLPVQMFADPAVAEGGVLLETADGWIEDGIDVRLAKLRDALDGLGVAR